MSLLDQIVAEHHSGPKVLSEQHDSSKINWVGGVTDPGEMIGCGKYQELRRLDGEADDAYQERLTLLLPTLPIEHRRQIEAAMSKSAIKRAGLDDSTGRIACMVAGEAPWHKLGVHVEKAVDSQDAIRLAGLNWRVDKIPLQYQNPATTALCQAPGCFAIVRKDTGAMLGNVGARYAPIQNEQGFAFLDGLLNKFGAKYESAGAIFGGSQVWMLVHLPKQAFRINGVDAVEPYAIFTNSHDGSSAAQCFPTTERVVCRNTLRVSLYKDGKKGKSIRHTGSIREKMGDAARELTGAVQAFEEFAEKAAVLSKTKVPDATHFFNDVLDAVLEVTEADAMKGADLLASVLKATSAEKELAKKSFASKIERRGEILNDIMARHESKTCEVGGMRGTGWGVLNAVTEYADHNTLGRKVGDSESRESRRFESVLSGPADAIKQVAYEKAIAYAV